MCMIDFGCYTNHSLGMNTVADYNEFNYSKGRIFTFICDRYSIGSFLELEVLSQEVHNHLRCGLEIDVIHDGKIIPVKCIAVSDNGIGNLSRIVSRANGSPLCIENLNDIRNGVLIGFSGGYDLPQIRDFADFWYLTPSFSKQECIEIYEGTKRSNKLLCAATDARYVNKNDEHNYQIQEGYHDGDASNSRGMWNHMLSENEMFEYLRFLGHQAGKEILINNPFKLLDPYWEYLSGGHFPVSRMEI